MGKRSGHEITVKKRKDAKSTNKTNRIGGNATASPAKKDGGLALGIG
jgi:hypothetical protein